MTRRHTVTVDIVTTTTDSLGNSTTSASTATVDRVLYAPEGLVENADSDSPTVVGDATLYSREVARLDADDTITHAGGCCDGQDFQHGTWQVVGGSKGWGTGKAVPIRRTGAS